MCSARIIGWAFVSLGVLAIGFHDLADTALDSAVIGGVPMIAEHFKTPPFKLVAGSIACAVGIALLLKDWMNRVEAGEETKIAPSGND